MNDTSTNETPTVDTNEQIRVRQEKLTALRQKGIAYPNGFKREDLAADLHAAHDGKDKAQLEEEKPQAVVAGRIMMQRLMGKASFIQIQDMSGRIQIYVRKNDLPEGLFEEYKHWDLGDIVGVQGHLFKTKTGELSVWANDIQLLTKSLRPLPDKWHGLTATETRYRQRYLDLIVNQTSRDTFIKRTKIVATMRKFLDDQGFMEVETPMMQVIPGGATARPFVTHHNALDMDLYLRIAPELYLKRLVVGGFERVYEINRNFRNEGLSTRHNPEFTMVEFYQAYATYHDLMDLTEAMIRAISQAVCGTLQITYQEESYDLSQPFARMTIKEAIIKHNPELQLSDLENADNIRQVLTQHGHKVEESWDLGKLQLELFEVTAEHALQQPTFITEYPTSVSPLARANDKDNTVTDRFEFFIAGRELANGFSELNDAEDQANRFKKQVQQKDAGDKEAMHYDADYITALEHGLPPTAGEGIGIDRLVMFFTDSASIRDVILFPHMRAEVRD